MEAIKSKIKTIQDTKNNLLQLPNIDLDLSRRLGIDIDLNSLTKIAKNIDISVLKDIGAITPQSIPMILWKYPQIIPETIRNKLLKDIQEFSLTLGGSIVGGVAVNLIVNKIYPPMRSLPLFTRIPLRLTLFSLPIVGALPILQQKFFAYIALVKIASGTVEQIQRIQKLGGFLG